MSRRTRIILMVAILLSIIIFLVLNLLLGSVSIPARSVIAILSGSAEESEIWRNIVLKSRLPQALTSIMAGAGLAVSGLLMMNKSCRQWATIS